jgi:P27 family predicted phage terminase small subunit
MKQRGRPSRAALEVVPIRPTVDRAPPAPDRPQPPPHLGAPECEIWRHVFLDYRQSTNLAVDVLRTGLESHMRAREARETIARDGTTVTGRDGQLRAHPLLAVERDARAAWLSAVKLLGLEL